MLFARVTVMTKVAVVAAAGVILVLTEALAVHTQSRLVLLDYFSVTLDTI